MAYSKRMLRAELERARAHGWDRMCLDIERREGLPTALLLAIASRETNMNDVIGDGGHGRGLFQIDDRSHTSFLTSQRANHPGGKPPVTAAARYAARLLKANLDYGRSHGVRARDLLKFAVSAYNAGAGGAIAGYREGDSDRRTTGRDYARDVLARRHLLCELLDGADRTTLARGMRGEAVRQLKASLAAWYGKHAPGEYERFRVSTDRTFGPNLERAVRDFQARVGLVEDGVVGPKTRRALERDARPRAR